MTRDLIQPHEQPHERHRKVRPQGPAVRVLLAEANSAVARVLRLALVRHGLGEPHTAEDAEEALDQLGAMAQNLDLVLVAHGPEYDGIDSQLVDVLRRIASPVRVACYGALAPEDRFDAARLMGTAAYIDFAGTIRIARAVREVVAAPVSVRHILSSGRVPATMSWRWAMAVYGAAPGESFARDRLESLNTSSN